MMYGGKKEASGFASLSSFRDKSDRILSSSWW